MDIKTIKQNVKKYWDEEREHKKSGKYACSNCKTLSDYTHFMFSDFLFDKLNLGDKKINREEFEAYCYELLKQGEDFIKSI